METGTVIWYNPKKGFGFIKISENEQCFVHYSSLKNKKQLNRDDIVNFDIENGEKGLSAKNVEVIK